MIRYATKDLSAISFEGSQFLYIFDKVNKEIVRCIEFERIVQRKDLIKAINEYRKEIQT